MKFLRMSALLLTATKMTEVNMKLGQNISFSMMMHSLFRNLCLSKVKQRHYLLHTYFCYTEAQNNCSRYVMNQ